MGLVRVASHKDFQGDNKPGDRTLSVFVGRGFYQFSTYDSDKPNIFDNIAYDLNLDGEWNYIQFGYVRQNDKSGKAKGYVYFQNQNIRETKFPDNVIHQLLKDYLYVGIGTSGKKLMAQFNGLIKSFKITFGKGGYLATTDAFKASLDGIKKPVMKKLDKIEEVIKKTEAFSRESTELKPVEFEEEFAGASEYAIGLWFRWLEIKRMPWEQLYTLTYNKGELR